MGCPRKPFCILFILGRRGKLVSTELRGWAPYKDCCDKWPHARFRYILGPVLDVVLEFQQNPDTFLTFSSSPSQLG